MDELIERSLASTNEYSLDTTYFIHDIQLGFLKEKASRDGRFKEFHKTLVERLVIFIIYCYQH